MPSFNHVVRSTIDKTFRVSQVEGMFDVPLEDKMERSWQVDMPIEDRPWTIGMIAGASGSGKTTIAREVFGSIFVRNDWPTGAVVDGFADDLEMKQICSAMSHVGFASPPSWVLPYQVLSTGQQFRVDLARAILESDKDKPLVFDEFTSVVDRDVARIGSQAVAKFVRKYQRQFVAVSCHYDIIDWLDPDWVYDVSSGTFQWRCLRRPSIQLRIRQVHRSAWQLFSQHHYLTGKIHKAARCFVAFFENSPVAFTSCISFPHAKMQKAWREHRTVTLPDYQGVGIGNALSEHMGDVLLSEGKRFISTTSHPSMIGHRNRSKKWKLTRKPSRVSGRSARILSNTTSAMRQSISDTRLTASFEYVG